MAQQYAPPPAPQQPAKKPIFKKWWFWVGIVLVVIIIASAAGGGGDDSANDASSAPSATTPAEAEASAPQNTAAETSEAAPAPEPADDPLSDGDWTASDVQTENSQFGTSLTARLTNNGDSALTGIFTITVFDASGARIGNFSGSANGVDAGDTQTVTFIGTTEALEGDPATFTYEFQDDGSF